MKKVLFVTGPALGHVGRSLVIARALLESGDVNIRIAGVVPGSGPQIIGNEFPFLGLPYHYKGDPVFADGLEGAIETFAPDLICLDMTPLPWLCSVRFPDIPLAYVTNYFIVCESSSIPSSQTRLFSRYHKQWNTEREKRGLPPLSDSLELYKRDSVILTDPPCILPPSVSLPENCTVVGPCCWEPDIDAPPELAAAQSLLYVSLGSTTRRPLPESLVSNLADALGIDTVVWPGSTANVERKQTNGIRYLNYPWLPASHVLPGARFALTQGGAGSTYQALMYGVPVGLWPSHENQWILGQRLDELGGGILFDDHWHSRILQLDSELQELQNRVRIFSESPGFAGGPERAAEALLKMLQESPD